MIEDKELRDIFRVEGGEHLREMEAGLLRLETNPTDRETLDEVFRHAHSLKGSARMLGAKDVEEVAHRLEDMFGALKKGTAELSGDFSALVWLGVDAVKKLLAVAVSGTPSGINVPQVLDALAGKGASPQAAQAEVAEGTAGDFRIDTVRVSTEKLDGLMAHAGELAVMKTMMANRLAQMDTALELWEEVSRRNRMAGRRPVSGQNGKHNELGVLLRRAREDAYEDNSKFEFLADALDRGIRDIRLLPFSTVFGLYRRMARDLAKERGKEMTLETGGGETKADKRIIEEMKDPVMHLVRNAVDHGIEPPEARERAGKRRQGTVRIAVSRTETNVLIAVSDDGRGLDKTAIRQAAARAGMAEKDAEKLTEKELYALIFTPGFSTSAFITDISGRGVGMDVVRANVERLKGTVAVESREGAGTTVTIRLPVSLSTMRALIASVDGRKFAVPVDAVLKTFFVPRDALFTSEGGETVMDEGRAVPARRLAELLEFSTGEPALKEDGPAPCVMMSAGGGEFCALVDELLDEQEIVVKPHGGVLKRVRNIAGAAILGSGEVCMVLNPDDLLRTFRKRGLSPRPAGHSTQPEKKRAVLLVEDTLTTRTQEKRILEGAGYEVVTAVDGLDALNRLAEREFDAVVSDILMPRMDGLTLTARIRQDPKRKELPVVLVTSLASDEHRRKGLEAGANAYIAKPAFDQGLFLDTLRRLM